LFANLPDNQETARFMKNMTGFLETKSSQFERILEKKTIGILEKKL
jgi:hypothetical protein